MAELRGLTNGLPSRTNVCTRRKRTCGPQGGSPGLTATETWAAQDFCGAIVCLALKRGISAPIVWTRPPPPN